MYVLKMKKHEKHAKKVVKIVHMIIKRNEWLNYVYEFIIFHKDQLLCLDRDLLFAYEVILEYVEHSHHLREDEHLVASLLQLGQQLVEQHHLATRLDDGLRELLHVVAVLLTRVLQNLLLGTCNQ